MEKIFYHQKFLENKDFTPTFLAVLANSLTFFLYDWGYEHSPESPSTPMIPPPTIPLSPLDFSHDGNTVSVSGFDICGALYMIPCPSSSNGELVTLVAVLFIQHHRRQEQVMHI